MRMVKHGLLGTKEGNQRPAVSVALVDLLVREGLSPQGCGKQLHTLEETPAVDEIVLCSSIEENAALDEVGLNNKDPRGFCV